MEQEEIRDYVARTFPEVTVQIASKDDGSPEIAWGDTFFIHKDDAHQFPFATIVIKDYGDFDNASNLNREGVWRLNIGVRKETFNRLFPSEDGHDFTALDVLMPHPIYGRNHFVCVLNPSDETFESLKPLIAEAYGIAAGRVERRKERADERA